MTPSIQTTGTDRAEPFVGSYFVATYPPFSTWDALDDGAWLDALDSPPRPEADLGLYVHVPFCVRRCTYCYYLSADDRPELLDAYLDAVAEETRRLAGSPAIEGRTVGFAYFGGGTPSMLSPDRLERLFRSVRGPLPLDDAGEITFECAPRSVTRDKLRVLKAHGVTRISIGVQQLDDAVLTASGRVHRVIDVERAWAAIREAHFPTVNVDLIVGLPGETERSFFDSLERIVAMGPESVTLYPLEIPLNTPLYRAIQDGDLTALPADWDVKRRRMARAFERLEESGYVVRSSNSAVRDRERHRFLYQERQYRGADLLGVGVASFSYVSGVHHQNAASFGSYLGALREGRLPLGRAHRLTPDERIARECMLELKLGGVDRASFRARHGVDPADRFADVLAALESEGFARVTADTIDLTRRGLLRVDRIAREFYLPHHRDVRYS